MEANVFVAKLKADGSKNDFTELQKAHKEFSDISSKLSPKDRAPFALNVLCILCRNIEKVPSWSAAVDLKLLLTMSLDCIRETQRAEYEQVKALACVYHVHRFAVRQKTAPPKLVLELSYSTFNTKELLKEYCKTYWNILGDRITYIEKLKAFRQDITKLYPKLIEDVMKIFEISGIEFCLMILNFLVKKLHYLYNDLVAIELNEDYGRIFEVISRKKDIKNLKKISYKDVLDIYVKLNDCLYIVAENSTMDRFRNSPLNQIVQTCISIIGHIPDVLYCIQNIYLNGFCSILAEKPNLLYVETIFTNLVSTCETSEKIGYMKAMNLTYPYINQFIKLFIEYNVTKNGHSDNQSFTEQIQIACLTLIDFLLKKLKNCNQILKCENCTVKTGLHDGLRLSLLVKDVIVKDLEQKIVMDNILPIYFSIIKKQYEILKELCAMGCANYKKCYKKLQSDIHNTAILLNKSQNFEYSIKLFEVYLKNEIMHFKNEQDMKNISRALYNKSICELDSKLYEMALQDAYLSLVFAYPDGLSSEKYMSLAMDIKAKEMKARDDDDDSTFQMMTVLDACENAVRDDLYGNLRPFFCELKFSELLEHEYRMYAKLWPSIGPMAAVCEGLLNLTRELPGWILAKDELARKKLHSIVLEAPSAARTVHNNVYAMVVNKIVQDFESNPPTTIEDRICQAGVMFLKSEFDWHEASVKYGWKGTSKEPDTEDNQGSSTLSQEYEAVKYCLSAVEMWADVVADVDPADVPPTLLPVLRIATVQIHHLQAMSYTGHTLQLAGTNCKAATLCNDRTLYLWNEAIAIRLSGVKQPSKANLDTETGLLHTAASAMHYNKMGLKGEAARLVQALQAKLLAAYSKNPDENLDLAMGYLLEAQSHIYEGATPNILTSVIATQRHYLSISSNYGRAWSETRARRLAARAAAIDASYTAAQTSVWLGLDRRARSAAALPAPPAATRARLAHTLANPHRAQDTQIKIDNSLKYTLGLQPSSDRPVGSDPDDPIRLLNPAWPPGPASGLAVRAAGLEAAMYFRAKQHENAKKYYEIAFKSFPQAEIYIKNSLQLNKFDTNVLEATKKTLNNDLRIAELEILIEAAYFELSQENYKATDENIVRINEILQENQNVSCYLKSEVLNLMTTSAYLRKGATKKIDDTNLEVEFENLRLSPAQDFGVPKTPDSKAENPPSIIKMKAKDEEVPNTKRRVIKLNLDENSEERQPGTSKAKNTDFKFPAPALTKPILEVIPPTPKRKPDILVTQPSVDSILEFATPKPTNKSEFFTPIATPSEQFFTPMSTIKTYTKKSLRHGLVKNLESEFCTPKSVLKKVENQSESEINAEKNVEKENLKDIDLKSGKKEAKKTNKENIKHKEISKPETTESKTKLNKEKSEIKEPKTKTDKENIKQNTGILSLGVPKRDKRSLKRATSPGKLEKKESRIPTRATRVRPPVQLSLDEDDKK